MQKYQLPDTPLPFVNTEIAEIEVDGQVRLVSSIWGGLNGGRIYIFNPDTGESICRHLPEGIGGAYMLRPASDGRLYLGCGEGSLVVYDPAADRFEVLVSGELDGITWGGCVTDSLAVWSSSPSDACVYNWRERKLLKTFRPLDSSPSSSHYAHNVTECPDGKILLGLNVPQAKLILLDADTLEAKSHTPEALAGQSYTQWLAFLDTERLAVVTGNEILILRYPSFELVRRIGPPGDAESGHHLQRRACCLIDGKVFSLFWPGGDLYRIDPSTDGSNWKLVRERFVGDAPAMLHALADRYVCALDTGGRFLRYDTQTGEIFDFQLDSAGPMDTETMCVIPQTGRIFGAPYINQRFWEIDLQTDRGADLGRAAPGGGQICCMAWDEQTARLIMASYTTCTVTAFDPAAPASWPENPRPLAKIGHEQMRPKSIAHDGRFVWLASSAEYGHLGGALSRLDPAGGEIRVWRNIVPNQTPNRLLINPAAKRIYFATEVYADGDSTPATERTAQLVAFDTENLSIDRQQAVRDGTRIARLLAMLPSGAILGLEGNVEFTWHLQAGTLFVWNPSDGSIEYLNEITENLVDAAVGPDGQIYASFGEHVCALTLEGSEVSFEPITRTGDWPGQYLQVHDGVLYFVVGNELWSIPLKDAKE